MLRGFTASVIGGLHGDALAATLDGVRGPWNPTPTRQRAEV